MIIESYISMVFRLINVMVTFAAGWYLFKKKVLPYIHERIQARQKLLEDLHLKNKLIKDQTIYLEEKIEQQKELYYLLSKHIALWNQQVEIKMKQREHEKETIYKTLEKKNIQQNLFLYSKALQKSVLPTVLANVTQQLEQRYKSQDAAHQYFLAIIARLKKEAA